MPTDHPTAEAMTLLYADTWSKAAPEMKALLQPIRSRAAAILSAFGDCPGFWGEVLAAVRVLADWPVCAIAQPKLDGHFWTITLPWTDTPRTITADTEPTAILAALRAVVGAV